MLSTCSPSHRNGRARRDGPHRPCARRLRICSEVPARTIATGSSAHTPEVHDRHVLPATPLLTGAMIAVRLADYFLCFHCPSKTLEKTLTAAHAVVSSTKQRPIRLLLRCPCMQPWMTVRWARLSRITPRRQQDCRCDSPATGTERYGNPFTERMTRVVVRCMCSAHPPYI